MPPDVLDRLQRLLNVPDLIVIAVALVYMVLGARRGLFGALYGLAGRAVTLAAARSAAQAAAPYAARWIVVPIVGEIFARRAALVSALPILEGLRQNVTEAAVSMAESVAFPLLLTMCCILFGSVVRLFGRGLRSLARRTPLGTLDALAGGVVGLATGVLLIALLLVAIEWACPITYTPLGWLSPERVQKTVLLAGLIDALPVAM